MQELADIISCLLLMHIKNSINHLVMMVEAMGLSTTIKFNNRSIGFARWNHIFHRLLDKSLRTQFHRTLSVELLKQPSTKKNANRYYMLLEVVGM